MLTHSEVDIGCLSLAPYNLSAPERYFSSCDRLSFACAVAELASMSAHDRQRTKLLARPEKASAFMTNAEAVRAQRHREERHLRRKRAAEAARSARTPERAMKG